MTPRQNGTADPSELTLVKLQKDATKSGAYFFAAFDEEGDFVHVKMKHNKTLSPKYSYSEDELRGYGFDNFMSKNENLKKGYLNGKGLKVNEDCHCIMLNDTVESDNNCNIKDCIPPKKTIQI